MDEPAWAGVLWIVGGYLAGTIPAAYLIARARHATAVIRGAQRQSGEADAHILMDRHLGRGWASVAGTLDVGKAFVFPLAAREWGGLSAEWLALVGVAIVIGHGWPPYARAMAGRGLSAMAGVFLALLPIPMVVTGVVILVGVIAGQTGPSSTAGMASAPVVAALQGQPSAYVAMAGAIFLVVLLRRLEGIGELVRGGSSWGRALYYRAIFDTDGPPLPQGAPGRARSSGS